MEPDELDSALDELIAELAKYREEFGPMDEDEDLFDWLEEEDDE